MRILVNDFAGHPFQMQLSRALALRGHEVLHTYFAANNTPKGPVTRATQGLELEGIGLGRKFNKYSILSRRFADMSYGQEVCERILDFSPDVVLSANTPLDAQRLMLATTKQCGGRFVFWLQDLLSVGIEFVLRKKRVFWAGVVGRSYERLERRLLQQSDAVVCIAPSFQARLAQWQVNPEKVSVIQNWAPLDEVYPLPRANAWATEQGLNGKFCFMYSGTLGMKHKPELLLELASYFQACDDVIIVVIAEGAGADWLKKNASHLRSGTLKLLPFQPYERLSEVLASSDVLITLLDEGCGEFAVPSKTLAYLCAARPQLLAAPRNNLAGEVVRCAGAGEVVAPAAADFIAAAKHLLKNAQLCHEYAAQARVYAERTFNIDQIAQRFINVFHFGSPHLLEPAVPTEHKYPVARPHSDSAGLKTLSFLKKL